MAKILYGPNEAKTYEQNRRSNVADILFWKLEEQELLNAICKTKKTVNKNILEVGCGTGRLFTLLTEKGHAVYGVDISPYMLAVASRKCRGKLHNVFLVRADAKHLPFRKGVFDFIFCIRVMNQLSSREYALVSISEFCRVCKKLGVMLIEFVNGWSLARFSLKHCTYLSIRDITRVLNECGHDIDYVHGILFFSQSIWRMLPMAILFAFSKFDAKICRFLPIFATRIYVRSNKRVEIDK